MAPAKEPPSIYAPMRYRAAALLLDLIALFAIAIWLTEYGLPGIPVFLSLCFLYFAGMPLSPARGTLGMGIFRIKLCDTSGQALSIRASLLRAAARVAWIAVPMALAAMSERGLVGASVLPIWWLVCVLPWTPASFLPRRQSLFDLLAGSVVVRYRTDPAAVPAGMPPEKAVMRIGNGTVAVVFAVGFGTMMSVMLAAHTDRDRRTRILYAMEQTRPLQEKVAAFYERERRWPTAAELGIPEWTPYPKGGGYRLGKDGTIIITFAVLPDLKGRSITFRPAHDAKANALKWQCSRDAGLKPGFLPTYCR